MKKSLFTLSEPDYPKKNFVLLFNTLTKSVSIIAERYFDSIQAGDWNAVPEDLLEQLYSQGFILKDDENEEAALNMFFTKIKTQYPLYSTMILTSYNCNMQCTYCFENSVKDNRTSMTEQTAHDVCKFLMDEFAVYNPEQISIVFSGGEPFLNLPAAEVIAEKIKKFADQTNKKFSFGFLTNGTIPFQKETASALKENGLDFLQYTLDGNREIHNQRRKMGDGSYDIIMENIYNNYKTLGINTLVRINIDKENADFLDGLLIDLKNLNIPNLTIDCAPRFKTSNDSCRINHFVLNNNQIGNEIIKFLKKVNKASLHHSRRFTDLCPCLAVTPRQFVVDPIGDLYKCAGFAGIKKFSVGSIYEKKLNKMYTQVVGLENWQKCKHCEFVPMCAGGCLFLNHIENKDFRKKACQYEALKGTVMQTLLQSLNKNNILENEYFMEAVNG